MHVLDARNPGASAVMKVKEDVECLGWNPHDPSQLYISTEDGSLACHDVRSASKPMYVLRAHNQTLSSFTFSPQVPGLLATCSVDKTVKLWDVQNLTDGKPSPVGEKNMGVGKLFTVAFYQSTPYLLATGGDKGMLAIWNLGENEPVKARFDSRLT